jgi:hypothetical protein
MEFDPRSDWLGVCQQPGHADRQLMGFMLDAHQSKQCMSRAAKSINGAEPIVQKLTLSSQRLTSYLKFWP